MQTQYPSRLAMGEDSADAEWFNIANALSGGIVKTCNKIEKQDRSGGLTIFVLVESIDKVCHSSYLPSLRLWRACFVGESS